MQPLTARRAAPKVPKADPAPSRLRYRLHRLMLTPGFRLLLRAGIPGVLAFAAGTWYLSDQERRDGIVMAMYDVRTAIEERPEFMVKLMAIDGAGPQVAEDIREILPIDFPISSFDLDLDQLRETVVELDAVKQARVRIKPGGVLQLDVTERRPAVLWRTADGIEMLDKSGVMVGPVASRLDRAELPLIAGEGADKKVAEALRLLAAAHPLRDRMRGLVRIGERRWDVVLDRNQRIMLPEQNPVQALERAILLDDTQDLLARDLAVVDMRNAARPTIRMTENAVREFWRIRETALGDQ